MKILRPCLVLTVLLLALCSGIYPALVSGIAQAVFSHQANGSLIEKDGKVSGSSLLGQTLANPSAQPDYFWGRPSAATTDKDTGVLVSGGSNYGPLNSSLSGEVDARIKALRDTGVRGAIPADLVTKSGSGLDPEISPEAAEIQVPRVAKERRLSEDVVRRIVREHSADATLGLLGEARVNVLEVNLALDERVAPKPPPPLPAPAPSTP
jgi:K+-transporting ATPase ATPase C chain